MLRLLRHLRRAPIGLLRAGAVMRSRVPRSLTTACCMHVLAHGPTWRCVAGEWLGRLALPSTTPILAAQRTPRNTDLPEGETSCCLLLPRCCSGGSPSPAPSSPIAAMVASRPSGEGGGWGGCTGAAGGAQAQQGGAAMRACVCERACACVHVSACACHASHPTERLGHVQGHLVR
jgi:hypothetical protein